MKKNYTHIVLVLDESGSMLNLTNDTIGGVNGMLEEQAAQPGELTTAMYTFNHKVKEVKDFTKLSNENYRPAGSTALLDAVCTAIKNEGRRLATKCEDERPDRVVIVIVTDGEENSSTEFKLSDVKDQIELQKTTYQWEFVFLGANINAFQEGNKYGIANHSTYQFTPNANSVNIMYKSLSSSMSSYRSGVTASVNMMETTEIKS
jgi:uncharacterized protein YegL